MNVTVIVLGILLVVLIYVLYLYLSPANTSLISSASLLTANPPINTIDSPTSPRYAYGFWIYVNSWDNTRPKTIFYRNNNIHVYLDQTQLNLNLDIWVDGTSGQNWYSTMDSKKAILITDNFPIQKWCYVVVSVDGNFVDSYLDGKLVTSLKLPYVPHSPPDVAQTSSTAAGASIVLGGKDTGGLATGGVNYTPFDAAINNFTRWSSPVNPQMVWDSYVSGNGSNINIIPKISSYNAKLNIMKNNAAYTSFSLF
jgi:hypothetical protein